MKSDRFFNATIYAFAACLVAMCCYGMWVDRQVQLTREAHGAINETASESNAVRTAYRFDRQTAAYRVAVAAVDTTTVASLFTGITEFPTGGRPSIPVSARFSAASQSCAVRIVWIWKDSTTNMLLDISDPVTITGTSYVDSDGRYVGPGPVFDTRGASHVRVIVSTAPASGTVSLWVGSY